MGLREATAQLQAQQEKARNDYARRGMVAALRKCPTPELVDAINKFDAQRIAAGETIAPDYDDHGQLVPPGPVSAQPTDQLQLKVDDIERQLAALKAHLAAYPHQN
jgi:hypothetical protein